MKGRSKATALGHEPMRDREKKGVSSKTRLGPLGESKEKGKH